MLHMLQYAVSCFQWVTLTLGSSTRHGRDMVSTGDSFGERFENILQLLHVISSEENQPAAPDTSLGGTLATLVVGDSMLSGLEAEWQQSHDTRTIYKAILVCRSHSLTTPAWLANAALDCLYEQKPGLERRRRDEEIVHFVRWAVLRDLSDRRPELLANDDDTSATWPERYVVASTALKKTEARGAEDTIKASYGHIQSEIDAGRGAKYLVWRDILRAAGLSLLDHAQNILGERRERPDGRRKSRTR